MYVVNAVHDVKIQNNATAKFIFTKINRGKDIKSDIVKKN